jgi:hypothetical protein
VVGGRAIHPINARLGGFYRSPTKSQLGSLAEQLKSVQKITRDLVRWTASLDFPVMEHDYEFVALTHPSQYPMNEGRLISSRGMDIAMHQFPEQFEEYQVPYSNALQCRRKGAGRISLVHWPDGTYVLTRLDPKSCNSPARPRFPGPAGTPMSASWHALSKQHTLWTKLFD